VKKAAGSQKKAPFKGYQQVINKKKMIIFNIVFRERKIVQNKSNEFKQVIHSLKLAK
jgi:hypothetical protein